jgi:predicted dienelactone hydrolase
MQQFKKLLFLFTLCTAPMVAVWAQVGMQTLDIDGLSVTMVYPTAAIGQDIAFGPVELNVTRNAEPSAGNRRLLVMSHGTGGSNFTDHELAATFARAGFVVAQPLHSKDNFKDSSNAGPESWKTRPLEVSKVIDALSQHPVWGTRFDANRVGVHGMSAGGVAALVLAGGQWRMLTMIQHCAAYLEEDLGFCLNGLNGDVQAQSKRKAQFKAGANAPEVFLPASLKTLHGAPNPRVKAVSLLVPVVAPFTTSSLGAIKIPVAVVSAQDDQVLAPRFHSGYLLSNCKSCTVLMDLKNAGHFDVLAPWPTEIAKEVASKEIRGGMPHPQFKIKDRAEAFGAIARFFQQQLQ